MSISFSAFHRNGEEWEPVADETIVNMISANAVLVGRAIGLDQYSDNADVWRGGACTVEQMRAALARFPDGHRDNYINRRLGELLRLVQAAERSNPPANTITWG